MGSGLKFNFGFDLSMTSMTLSLYKNHKKCQNYFLPSLRQSKIKMSESRAALSWSVSISIFFTNNYGFSRSSLFFSVPGFQWSWMVCIYGPPKFRPIKIRRSTRRKSTSISECSRTEFWLTIIRKHILLRKKSKILRTFGRKLLTGACSKSIFSEINKSRIWAESFRNIFDQNMVRKNHNVTWSIFIKSGSSRTDDSSTSKNRHHCSVQW